MHCLLSRSLHRHARLKLRAAAGSALPRRRFQATEAAAAGTGNAATDASSGPSSSTPPAAISRKPTWQFKSADSMKPLIYTPQHLDHRTTPLSQHTAYPASSTLEQLALLEVCLAVGNITRARKVFEAIKDTYAQEDTHQTSASEQYDDFDPSSGQWRRRLQFSDVIPVSVHAQFLRAYFRQAIVQDSAKLVKGNQLKKRAAVSQAWEWFEMLLSEESTFGRLDDTAWAIMLKGLVATKLANPNLTSVDPAAPHLQPISYLYELMKAHGRSLRTILQDSIFSHGGIAGLNDHPALEVCEELAAVLAQRGETDALVEVDAVKQDLIDALQYEGSAEAKDVAAEEALLEQSEQSATPANEPSSSTPSTAATSQLQPAKRKANEEVPFKLNSLVANLEAVTTQRKLSQDPYVRQDLLEESGYDAALWQTMHDQDQIDKIGLGTEVRLKTNVMQENMARWLDALKEKLDTEFSQPRSRKIKQHHAVLNDDADIKDLLSLIPVDKLAYVTIIETLRSISHASTIVDGVKAARAIITLGRAVEDEYGAQAWKQLYPDLYDKAMKKAQETARKTAAIRQFMQEQGIAAGAAKEARVQGYGDEADDLLQIEDAEERQMKLEARQRALPWTQKMRARVGGYLIMALLDTATVKRTGTTRDGSGETFTEFQPAFWQSYQFVRSQKVGVIKLNPVIADRMDKDHLGAAAFPRYLPMLVKPKPWTGWNKGGYRIHSTPVMRTKDCIEQEQYVRLAAENGQMTEVFAALDALGSTAWRINRPIYDIVTQVWNSGEALGDIPMDNAETKIPAPAHPAPEEMEDPSYREAYRVQLKEIRTQRSKAHSQRCSLNYKLEIARAFLDETFYFPHNIDFRGRAYPIPPNLSHMGDDITRGLLEFAEGRPLGKRGLTWLHVQLANAAGFDKASLDDRENFAKKMLPEIMDSADKPLDGNRWWLKADDPWQCLAACMELTKALRSPVPEEFISHIPVQQDGTCNGLQHYAALGGDRNGAEQVNLAVGQKPADVYTAVANLVNREIEKDLEEFKNLQARFEAEGKPVPELDQPYPEALDLATEGTIRGANTAGMLKGKVTRKVVKQTVMTTVYGVTFIGAKRQIARQLRDRGDIPTQWQYSCANYLAEKVLSCIGDLFKGASRIQLWLSICARLIGRSVLPQEGKTLSELFKFPMASVIWTTPLGLPVAQPYRKLKKTQVTTALQSVFIVDPNMPAAIDPRAQATAFPPNYVHSLDATHMMMTAVECKRRGLVYASVHDSYWTHACDVDEMSAALRDCFIKLHSRPLLKELKDGFEERYAGYVVRKNSVQQKQSRNEVSLPDNDPRKAMSKFSGQEILAEEMISEMQKDLPEASVSTSSARSSTDEDSRHTMNIQDIAAQYGASALPPLAVATDERMIRELKALEAREGHESKTDEQLLAEEEKLFNNAEDLESGSQPVEGVAGDSLDSSSSSAPEQMSSDDLEGKSLKSLVQLGRKRGKYKKRDPAEAGEEEDDGKPRRKKKTGRPLSLQTFQARSPTCFQLSKSFPEIPARGDFDLEIIRDSPYFFS